MERKWSNCCPCRQDICTQPGGVIKQIALTIALQSVSASCPGLISRSKIDISMGTASYCMRLQVSISVYIISRRSYWIENGGDWEDINRTRSPWQSSKENKVTSPAHHVFFWKRFRWQSRLNSSNSTRTQRYGPWRPWWSTDSIQSDHLRLAFDFSEFLDCSWFVKIVGNEIRRPWRE
jgi:hypothetical protein